MIPPNIEHNFAGHVHEAIGQGLNTEILLRLTGDPLYAFNAKLRDDKYTIEEKNKIYTAIESWKNSLESK
ncbi:MAG: hypothetical protein BWY67_00739 [Bacteroidetes bacterium ADurb.Bin397]|nr:MAG: hypothetical protein BWY67_00739 [Bacteroidetes bacterium ADurb.Bin397]